MADLQTILDEVKKLRQSVEDLPGQLRITGASVVVVNGLSDIDENLGLVQAGEFRSGNRVSPGDGFSGVRIGYPGFTYGGSIYNIAGVDADTLMFGLRSSDGAGVFGGGNGIIDRSGILLVAGADAALAESVVRWQSTSSTNDAGIISSWVGAGFYSRIGMLAGMDETFAPSTDYKQSNAHIAAASASTSDTTNWASFITAYSQAPPVDPFLAFEFYTYQGGVSDLYPLRVYQNYGTGRSWILLDQTRFEQSAVPGTPNAGTGSLWTDTGGNLRFTDTVGENWFVTRSTAS